MANATHLIRTELVLIARNRAFLGLILLLFSLMTFATWNTHNHLIAKKRGLDVQLELVRQNDQILAAQIDSLNEGLASYEDQYTLPSSGVRLTYNNHRVACMPIKPYALTAIGQGDLYSSYKKIVLYFNDSYERATHELVSPVEQLFGQLDLAFIWTYLLPLIIILTSFNLLAREREMGRLKLIASQPIKVSHWLFIKIGIRFGVVSSLLILFSFSLLAVFDTSILAHSFSLIQLGVILFLYTAFWFLLSLLVNLLGYSSGRSLILLTNLWVLLVFLIPSIVNLLGKELHPIPSRLEMINHHQAVYNEMENRLEEEKEALFRLHPDWVSDDPITKDMSHPTGWNIDYLAKQYIAQLKHQPKDQAYENQIDKKNQWFSRLRILSPAMIFQSALADLAGTSTRYYRSFLHQVQVYAQEYRVYVFKGLFTNHAFTANEIKHLPEFNFDEREVPSLFRINACALLVYGIVIGGGILIVSKINTQIV